MSRKRSFKKSKQERYPKRRRGSERQREGKPNPDATYPGIVRFLTKEGAHVEVRGHKDGGALIPREEAAGLREGQRVTVRFEVGRKGRLHAKLVAKGERKSRTVGVVVVTMHGVLVVPEPEGPAIAISEEDLAGAKEGDAVVVDIVREAHRERPATGRVVEVLGSAKDPRVQVEVLVRSQGLPLEFSERALAQAEAFPAVDAARALAADPMRRDLRGVVHVTIDGEDARDFDDAVAAVEEGDAIRVWVSIADVSAYVEDGTPIDGDAREHGTSVYFPDRVVPMLPERLSNDLCSLRPHEPRLTLTCEMVVQSNGRVRDVQVYASLIESAARLTYTEVQAAIEQKPSPAAAITSLPALLKASRWIRAQRKGRGAIDLDLPESMLLLDANGVAVHIRERARFEAHKLIEDLMIAANEAVARFLSARGWPTLYRVHEPPDPVRLMALQQWAETMGLTFDVEQAEMPRTLARLAELLHAKPQGAAGQTLLLRSLAQARYDEQNLGHYGLASRAYLHFTSPIRRYPDLIVHRALRALWRNEGPLSGLDHLGERTSAQERRAMEAERAVRDLMACHVAERHIGEAFEAMVTGVHQAGAFVRTRGLLLEGLLGKHALGDATRDYYELDVRSQSLFARRSGHRITIGDLLEVRLVSVDTTRRHIAFELAKAPKIAPAPHFTPAGARAKGRSSRTPPRPRKEKPGRSRQKPGRSRR